jgi:hypothetical protein
MPLDATNRTAIPLKGGYRVETVKGTVRTLGQSRMHMSGHHYAFVKFDVDGGGEVMIEGVAVLNSVGSELEPGVMGTFHIVSNKRASAVVAFEGTDGRKGDDVATFRKSILRGNLGIIFFLVTAWVVVSSFSGLILMALFRHAPFFVWVLYYIAPPVLIFRHVMKRIPSEAEIRAAIAASAV